MTTKEKPQVGDVWQHVNGQEAYVVDPGGFPPGGVYFTMPDRACVRFGTDGSVLTRLLYRPRCVRLEQATRAALLECAKIAAAPFAPQDNLTPEQCVDAVRKLRESCNDYVNKAGERLATRSRQIDSQAATIKVLQDQNATQYKQITGQMHSIRKLESKLHDADKRERELGHMVEALHSRIRNLCEAHKIPFLVGDTYMTALGRIGAAIAGRKSNVTDVPRGIPPVVELTQAEKDSIMDRVFAWHRAQAGANALMCANALWDHVAELCAKRAVSQPAFTPSEGIAEVNQALDKLTATLVRHGYVQST